MATRRKQQRRGPRSQRLSNAQLRVTCEQEYEGLRDQVMQFLILEKWVSSQAAAQGVALSAEELDKAFRRAKRDTFPKESDFRKFLELSGMTVADARFQIAFNTTYTRLRDLAIAAAVPVTDTDIAAYYDANVARFFEPETRDAQIVLTTARAKANAARAALERGQTFRHVARKYSIDRASRGNRGLLLGVAEGSQEAAFDKALFRAPRFKLRGPIKVRFGYYVFKVVKITRAKQLTLAQASPAIRDELTAQRQREADDAFNDGLVSTWRPRTHCRAGYVTSDCANGPLPKPPEDEGPTDDVYPDL